MSGVTPVVRCSAMREWLARHRTVEALRGPEDEHVLALGMVRPRRLPGRRVPSRSILSGSSLTNKGGCHELG